ncbi:MAG TPA: tetratricopeptide repeat protein [Kofleriaceae bacterium]|nr:tetratricopeptide repeat protein [Kofleriaceae bacterium]
MLEAAFRDLRKLADWFSTSPGRPSPHIGRIVERLGPTAVPLLGRQLRSLDPRRREAARDALAAVAAQSAAARSRVTAELHALVGADVADEAKVVALGLLSELGEHAEVRFADPTAIRVRSAIALASQLETAADLAGAADLMVHELVPDDIVQMLDIMGEAVPVAAHRLAGELVVRLDLPGEVRDRIALAMATFAPRIAAAPARTGGDDPREHAEHARRGERPRTEPVHTAVLVDAAARLVVVASQRHAGARRWRRWAVLIGASGRIEDALHQDDAGSDGDTASLSATLCADGYRVASREPDKARDVVAAAARRTAEASALPSPYYLGRDLLELGDAHLGGRRAARPATAALAHAIELVASGDHDRALPLLEAADPDNPDAAAALAAVLLARSQPRAALAAVSRALAVEPDWPLHHWNLAAALHQLGDARGCYHALCRFVATSARPSGLFADPEQPARVGRAERMIAQLERTARLSGQSLKRRTRARKKRGSAST